jgi:tetratricopeptide (TPR) repeat protein
MLIGESSDEEVWKTLERGLSRAEEFHATGRFREELSVLSELVASFSRAPGSWNERIRAKLFASVATAHLELGELDEAYRSTQRALDECVNSGDTEGIYVYRKNLEFIDSKRLVASHDPEFMRRLIEAQRLSDSGQFDVSNERLQELLRHATENPDHRLLGKIWGLMGFNLFKSHDTLGARAFTAKALDACRSSKDAHGITIYEFNLAFIDKNIGAQPNSTSGDR